MTSKRDIFVKTIATRRSVYSQDRLEQILSESVQAKEKEPGDRTAKDYRRIKRFDIVDVQGKQRLVAARADNDEKDIRFFVSIEEMYDIIDYTHKKMNHGGRDRLWPILSKQYANIPREVIQTYLKMCDYCCKRRKRISSDQNNNNNNENGNSSLQNESTDLMETSLTNIIHDIPVLQQTNLIKHEQQQQQQHMATPSPPIVLHNQTNSSLQHQQQPVENIFDGRKCDRTRSPLHRRRPLLLLLLANSHVMNRLCEYDLIDLQNAHDGDHGFVLVYQDYLTKFTQLRPLKSKSPVELGTTLMDIFCIFGPPLVLQSSADLHIENSAIQQTLEAVWPGRKTKSFSLRRHSIVLFLSRYSSVSRRFSSMAGNSQSPQRTDPFDDRRMDVCEQQSSLVLRVEIRSTDLEFEYQQRTETLALRSLIQNASSSPTSNSHSLIINNRYLITATTTATAATSITSPTSAPSSSASPSLAIAATHSSSCSTLLAFAIR